LILGIANIQNALYVIKNLAKFIYMYYIMDIYIILLICIIFLCAIINPIELFSLNPQYILPPGYTNLNYKFNNSKIPIIKKTEYCKDNPDCYPCYGWTKIGNPECV